MRLNHVGVEMIDASSGMKQKNIQPTGVLTKVENQLNIPVKSTLDQDDCWFPFP